jgi:MFS family permease
VTAVVPIPHSSTGGSFVVTLAQQPSFLATRRGKLTLVLLCTVAFLDLVDASIVNVALPSIRHDLHFSVQSLQWIPSAYLLTYGGFMLLGGRAADLLGRRRVLVCGTTVFALSSFAEGGDRNKALGAWGGTAGLASAVGVFLGGVLTEGPGWRWVLFVNPPICLLVLGASFYLLAGERREAALADFDVRGALLATGGMLLLVFALVRAPEVGWGTTRTIGEIAGAFVLLGLFLVNERRHRNPLLPLSIFRVRGLAAADATQLIALAGLLAMFFFLTLYMQNVLGYSPIKTGAAYLPVCLGVAVSAGASSQLLARTGTRPLIVGGLLVGAAGVYLLSRIPVDGSYVRDVLPGMVIMSIGLGAAFVAVTTAANAGVRASEAGLAAALLNASQQLGGALGLAIFSAVATARTNDLLAAHTPLPDALDAGFQRALLASCLFLLGAAVIGLRTRNAHSDAEMESREAGMLTPRPTTSTQ